MQKSVQYRLKDVFLSIILQLSTEYGTLGVLSVEFTLNFYQWNKKKLLVSLRQFILKCKINEPMPQKKTVCPSPLFVCVFSSAAPVVKQTCSFFSTQGTDRGWRHTVQCGNTLNSEQPLTMEGGGVPRVMPLYTSIGWLRKKKHTKPWNPPPKCT